MNVVFVVLFFVLGIVFGSFYNVVGYRIPKKESIIYPPSHCPKCNHRLKSIELIPILSYVFLGGKCRNCKQKISIFYSVFEFVTGMLFALSYIVFGFSLNCLFSIVFVSMLIIIIISDYQTMIIPDSILIVFSLLLIIIRFFIFPFSMILTSLLNALLSFIVMFLLKLLGDFLFKKESMGGGDIKLMAIFGFVFNTPLSIIILFLSAFIGLPISLIILKKKNQHEIPYGPFLAISAMIVLFLNLSFNEIINFLII